MNTKHEVCNRPAQRAAKVIIALLAVSMYFLFQDPSVPKTSRWDPWFENIDRSEGNCDLVPREVVVHNCPRPE